MGGAAAEVRAIGLRAPDVALEQAFRALGEEPSPSGTGRGAAVDRAVAVLRAGGARKGLVNFGGGRLAVFGEPLTVTVRDPGSPEAPRWATFELGEAALATVDRDPQASHSAPTVLSATVVAGTAGEAEALAVAAVALDADQSLALLAQRGAAGFVLLREGERKVLRATPGFAGAHRLEATPGVDVRP